MTAFLLGATAAAAALCSACGLEPDGAPSDPSQASTGTSTESLTSTFKEAPHGPLPQVTNHGGAIVANPRVITVTFKNYPYTPDLVAFAAWLPTTKWFSAWSGDYGIKTLTTGSSFVIPTAPPVTDLSNFEAQPERRPPAARLPGRPGGVSPHVRLLAVDQRRSRPARDARIDDVARALGGGDGRLRRLERGRPAGQHGGGR